jgi:hypothetical protein
VHIVPSQLGACEAWAQAVGWQQVAGTQSASVAQAFWGSAGGSEEARGAADADEADADAEAEGTAGGVADGTTSGASCEAVLLPGVGVEQATSKATNERARARREVISSLP